MSTNPEISVLVVEDHNIVREGIVSIINRQKDLTVVGEARNGEEAIALYNERHPDVTLMDLRMPKMEGLEAIVQIRQNDSKANIIILTTYDTDEDIYQGLQAGARGYLLKDATTSQLTEAVRQVNAGKRYLPDSVAEKLLERIAADELTQREKEVLELMVQGSSTAKLAETMNLSEGTIKFHINNIFQKLGVNDRAQAIVVALRRGIIRLDSDREGQI